MEVSATKTYKLDQRTLEFSKEIRHFTRLLPRSIENREDSVQLVRSSGSIGANYIEACECLSKKDFLMRLKIAKKEARESIYWLNLVSIDESQQLVPKRNFLINEATELMKIFGSIISKTTI